MTDFAWGLIGPGGIAHRFADAVYRLPGTHLRSVLGRDAAKANAFVQHWSRAGKPAPQLAPTLEALLADDGIDGIYIATPHASHGEFARRCIAAGKPVLCEKVLVPSLPEAQALVALALNRQVFLMEALWTRFLPLYALLRQRLQAGDIGSVHAIQSSFCFAVPFNAESRLFNPALAGGTLLDIGIYNIAATRWILQAALGHCPEPTHMHATGTLAPTGVDQRVTATLEFPQGITSQFTCAFDSVSNNALHILGSQGSITLPRNFWEATEATLQRPGHMPELLHAAYAINGFEGEIEETMRCVRTGLLQSPLMPHSETLAIMGWLDELRRQLGVRYPFESKESNAP